MAARSGDKDTITQVALPEKVREHLNEARHVRTLNLGKDDLADLYGMHLMTVKPTMYIANVDEDGFENNPFLDTVRQIAEAEGASVVPICNKLESEIAELDDSEKAEFLQDLGMEEPG